MELARSWLQGWSKAPSRSKAQGGETSVKRETQQGMAQGNFSEKYFPV